MSFPREEFFSTEEYARRTGAVRSRMADKGHDLFITGCPANIYYLTGYFTINLWDPTFLVIAAEGSPLLIIWEFERGRFLASAVAVEVDGIALGADAAAHVVQCIKNRGWHRGKIAVDVGGVQTRTDATVRLLNGLSATPMTGLVEPIRLVKSPAEIQRMREAAAFTDKGMEAALAAVHEGVRDHEIAAAAAYGCWRAGGEFFAIEPLVCVGWKSGTAHSSHGRTKAATGDPVFLEIGAVYARYCAPLMRTAVIGEPSRPEIREFAAVSIAAVDAVVDTMRPGMAAADVAQKGLDVVKDVLDRVSYHKIFGYPVGIGFPPSWVEESNFFLMLDNPRELRAGMTFHLPLTFRVVGEYGVGFSETVVVTETGAEKLSKMPRELVVR